MERFNSRRYFTSISATRLLVVAQSPDQLSHAIRASDHRSSHFNSIQNPRPMFPIRTRTPSQCEAPSQLLVFLILRREGTNIFMKISSAFRCHISATSAGKTQGIDFFLLHSSTEVEAIRFSFRRLSIILMVQSHKMLQIHVSVSSEFFSVRGKCCYNVRNMSALSVTFAPCPHNVNLLPKLLRSKTFLSISSGRHLETTLLTSSILV
jgi:hypothetical protein